MDPEVVSVRTYDDYQMQWEAITHSCKLIGYGYHEDLKMKYWVVRNSYGNKWGEKGNLMLRRGMNDFGCEGEISAVIP
jgi:cathepsin C